MPEQAPAPPLRSIAQSLSVAVTAITTMVTVASLAAMLGYTWKRDQQAQRRQADETVRSLTESLRLPLWFLDTETITVIGRAVAQDETVARLEIIGSGERPVFSEGRAVPVAFVRSAQVLYQGRPVGEVRLAVSDGRRQRLLWSVAVVAGLTGLLVTGVQLVLIGPLLRHRLRAAFASLDATIREYLAGRYDPPPPRVRYSEFQPLTEVLVQMGRTVERQLSELSVAEAKYRRIFEKARVGIFQTTLGGAVVDANPALAETLGYASREAVLAALRDVGTQVYADPEDRDRLLAQLQRDGRVARYQVRMRRLDGSPLWASVTADAVQDETGRQVLIEGLLDDVTEHEELQELRLQAEKMASVGGLAAGMAHELNNPLGIILQAVESLERRFSPDLAANRSAAAETGVDLAAVAIYMECRGIRRYLEAAREAADRAAATIRTMLEFSRREGTAQTRLCPLAPIVEKALELASNDYDLRRRFDFRSVQVVRELDPATPPVPCSESELVQVVFNIVKNAAEALEGDSARSSPPAITIRARADGGFARLEVEDNGPGIDDATRRRIFEPYFSTKGRHGGTGLGLAVVYFIVTQRHGGTVSVDSTPGQGTRFVLRLPAGPLPSPVGAGGSRRDEPA